MLIVRALAGYSMGRSDIIRKAMGKKKQDVMDREKEVFLYGNEKTRKEGEALVPGCVKNGISEQVALKIWDKMVKFAEYAFNKSHAACYAYIALQTAILKKYYPEEFMAATLTSVIGNNKKLPFYVNACQKTMGIPIETPDINESEAGFTPLEHGIRFGLEAIKSVGEVLSFEIINERKANGPYKSLFDFCTRLARNKGLNKNAIESLIKAGSFDFTGYNRAELLNAAPAIFDAAKKQADETSSGQISLFSMLSGDTDEYLCPEIKRMPDFPEETRLKHEREVTSLFISGHPLNRYSRAISEAGCVSIREIRKSFEAQDGRFSNKQSVNLAIVLYNVKKRATKKGTMMVNASIQDIDSEAQVTAFSKTLEIYDFLFKEDSILLAKASIDVKDEGEISFIINGLYVMPIDGSSEEDFAAFKKEVVPYKRNNKPQRVAAPVAPPVPKTKSSKYQPGLYLRVPTYDDMPRFIAALNTGRGQTAVFLYCEENKKMYYNPSLKVNINDPTLIKNIKENVRSKEDIKIIK